MNFLGLFCLRVSYVLSSASWQLSSLMPHAGAGGLGGTGFLQAGKHALIHSVYKSDSEKMVLTQLEKREKSVGDDKFLNCTAIPGVFARPHSYPGTRFLLAGCPEGKREFNSVATLVEH